VGDLWLHVEAKSDGLHAFGYAFEVRQELRRHGYGRAITAAAEQKCREMNVVSIGLTVFGPNKAAQSLYEDLGFEVTALQMRKRVSAA
jgi:ribosomal protein S18 acetylase RimI-like enzyme